MRAVIKLQVRHTIDAVRRIGLGNVISVLIYRILLQTGMHLVQKVHREIGGEKISSSRFKPPELAKEAELKTKEYIVLTLHRPSNVVTEVRHFALDWRSVSSSLGQ